MPHYIHEHYRYVCYLTCLNKAVELQNDCPVDCYYKKTKIMNGTSINLAGVKAVYEHHVPYYQQKWKEIIASAMGNCSFDSTQNLVKYYDCVNDHLAENCISFYQTPECQEVEEHHDECKKVEVDCTKWPVNLTNPEYCCGAPLLYPQTLKTKCWAECEKKEFLLQLKHDCVLKCQHNKTIELIDGKAENIKKILVESSGNDTKWEHAIDLAVKNCDKLSKNYDSIDVSIFIFVSLSNQCRTWIN